MHDSSVCELNDYGGPKTGFPEVVFFRKEGSRELRTIGFRFCSSDDNWKIGLAMHVFWTSKTGKALSQRTPELYWEESKDIARKLYLPNGDLR